MTHLSVTWGATRLHLRYPLDAFPIISVADIKNRLEHETGVPYVRTKLIHRGAVLGDDKRLLAEAGVRPGDKLIMMGFKVAEGFSRPSAKAYLAPAGPVPTRLPVDTRTPERKALDSIASIIEDAHRIPLPLLVALEATAPDTPPQVVRDMHAKASEIVLQYLIRVDGVQLEGHEQVRTERRKGVRLLQSWIDRADYFLEHRCTQPPSSVSGGPPNQ